MKYSRSSLNNLSTCHQDLQDLFHAVLEFGYFDLTIIEGKRSLERQKQLFNEGASKTMKSKHLTGHAVDVGIYKNGGIDWNDKNAYYVLAGIVTAISDEIGVKVRWGGNWDKDRDFDDQSFNDLVHWELV
jgi:peptidoglycan L-alanyl-D-glutamate endopeptidase CwlK